MKGFWSSFSEQRSGPEKPDPITREMGKPIGEGVVEEGDPQQTAPAPLMEGPEILMGKGPDKPLRA